MGPEKKAKAEAKLKDQSKITTITMDRGGGLGRNCGGVGAREEGFFREVG